MSYYSYLLARGWEAISNSASPITHREGNPQMTPQTYECEHCGNHVSHLSAVHVGTHDTEAWCDDCIENDTVECDHCGHLILDYDAETVRVGDYERAYCPDCADEHATVCDCCNDLVINCEVHRAYIYGTGYLDVCDDCIENDTVECDHCGHLILDYDAETVRVGDYERAYCPDCADEHATVCDCCNDLVINCEVHRAYIYGTGYLDVCENCLEDYYCCSNCGKFCTEDDVEYHNGEYYCPECAPSDYLSDYHHTDAETFLHVGNDESQPYLGVELEMEFPTATSRAGAAEYIRCNTAYGDYYDCKEDSSLSEYGMEVVTQPATPAYHMAGYNDVMLAAGKDYGATSHDNGNCGLHVHIDRGYFVATDIQYAADRAGYIMDCIFSNNEAQIVNFTRRRYSQLNRWAQLMNMGVCKTERSLSSKLAEYRSSKYTRYQAVNMDNSETIELRLFRGTLNHETYYATLEFAAALAYLTRALLSIPDYASTLTWADLKTELFAALELEGISSTALVNYLKRRDI